MLTSLFSCCLSLPYSCIISGTYSHVPLGSAVAVGVGVIVGCGVAVGVAVGGGAHNDRFTRTVASALPTRDGVSALYPKVAVITAPA